LEQWKEQQKDLLREQRERAQELKRELQADLGKVVDEAKGEGRGR
jgi:vacuolar-type H+-ATPase subunit H